MSVVLLRGLLTSVTIGYYRPAAVVEGRAQNYYSLCILGDLTPSVVLQYLAATPREAYQRTAMESHVSYVPIDIMFYFLLLCCTSPTPRRDESHSSPIRLESEQLRKP
ncbi:hypothetical protein OH76DRAFT_659694 [Lentinus brumalis]|uniref:Uncharacterized protein n=1 Tax=Lentinus brumalis TaxID=2498619 RepID=A0A371D7L3_9APHY|nr:hypothetical protein OH76DRAFT_659694 [Polyporus brumalis]